MKSQHYLAIIVRLFAIALFVHGLRQCVFVADVFYDGIASGIRFPKVFTIATALVPMLFSVLLWFFPLTISKSIVSDEYNHEVKPLNPHSFLTVLIISLGLYFLFYAIVDSIYWVIVYKASQIGDISGVPIGLGNENKANMYSTGLEFILAFGFIAKAKTIGSNLLRFSQ